MLYEKMRSLISENDRRLVNAAVCQPPSGTPRTYFFWAYAKASAAADAADAVTAAKLEEDARRNLRMGYSLGVPPGWEGVAAAWEGVAQ